MRSSISSTSWGDASCTHAAICRIPRSTASTVGAILRRLRADLPDPVTRPTEPSPSVMPAPRPPPIVDRPEIRSNQGEVVVKRPALTLAAVAVVQFMVSLDLSVVNVGLPRIASGLGFGAVGATWVVNAYALTFGGLLLVGGAAADRYGRKGVLLAGLGVFALASLAGGLAQAPGELVAA